MVARKGCADHRRVILQLDLATRKILVEVRQLLEALVASRTEVYEHGASMGRYLYWKLRMAERGLPRAQVAWLIAAYLTNGELADERKGTARPFRHRYTREDILLLAETGALHGRHFSPATMVLLLLAFEVSGEAHWGRRGSPTATRTTCRTPKPMCGCLERIAERYLLPVLERPPASFPFAS